MTDIQDKLTADHDAVIARILAIGQTRLSVNIEWIIKATELERLDVLHDHKYEGCRVTRIDWAGGPPRLHVLSGIAHGVLLRCLFGDSVFTKRFTVSSTSDECFDMLEGYVARKLKRETVRLESAA